MFVGVAVARALLNRQTSQAQATAFRNVFEGTTRRCPAFDNGKKLQGITVDFSDAEAKGLRDVLGREFVDKILRGCKVDISKLFCMQLYLDLGVASSI